MSRNFRSGEFVNHGSGATLDNLSATAFSGWVWVYRGANGTNQHIITKETVLTAGWNFLVTTGPGEGALTVVIRRATTPVQYVGATGNVALNAPGFAAFSFDSAASPNTKLYFGTQGAAVIETASYATAIDGTGAIADDSAASVYVGNLQRGTTVPWVGGVQMGGLIAGSVLTAAQFESIRVATRNAVLDDTTLSRAAALFTHVLLFNYQSADVTDRSGNGNNGTVTGAQSGSDFPVVPAMGWGSQSSMIIDPCRPVSYR